MVFNMSTTVIGGGSEWIDISDQLSFININMYDCFAVCNGTEVGDNFYAVVNGQPTAMLVQAIVRFPFNVSGEAIAKQVGSTSSVSGSTSLNSPDVTFSGTKGTGFTYNYFITGTIMANGGSDN